LPDQARSEDPAAGISLFFTGVAAMVAGVAWIGRDIGPRVSPDPDYFNCNSSYDYLLNGIDTVAFVVLGFAILGLRILFKRDIGSTMAWIGNVAAGALVVAGVANLFEHCAGLDALGFPYVIGLTLGLLLLIVFSFGLIRTPLPRWVVWLLVIGTGLGILLANQGGFIAFGIALIVLGTVLLRKGLGTDPASP
jgi:hypothetical protein